MHIVLAMDKASIRELLRDVLELEGVAVTCAETYEAAWTVLERTDVDGVIVDLFNSRQTAPSLRDTLYLRRLARRAPVILTSAHIWAARLDPDRFRVSAFVRQPFDTEQLRQLVDGLHERRDVRQS